MAYTLSTTVPISTSSVANPSVITCPINHGLITGQTITIRNHSGSTPTINGSRVVTVTGVKTFTIPLNVTVAGTGGELEAFRDFDSETLSVKRTHKGTDYLKIDVLSANGLFRINDGAKVTLYESAVASFGGFITESEEQGWANEGTVGIRTSLVATGFKEYANFVQYTGNLAAGDLKTAVLIPLAALLAPYGVTLDGAQASGPTVVTSDFDNQNVGDILDQYMGITRWVWEIGPDNVLRSFDPAGLANAFDISTANQNAIQDIKVSRVRNKDYANRVVVRGGQPGEYQVSYNEVHYGDGATRQFYLDKPMDYFGPVGLYITISGVPTLYFMTGYYGIDTDEYVFDPFDSSIHQRVDQPILSASDSILLIFGYSAIYPLNVIAEDLVAQAEVGYVKTLVIPQPKVYDRPTLTAIAEGALLQKKVKVVQVKYRTAQLGALPGRTQQIDVAERDLSGTFTIIEVETKNVKGNRIEHFITAVEGDQTQPTWREWYNRGSSVSGGGFSSATSNTGGGGGVSQPLAAGPVQAIQSKGTDGLLYGDENALYDPDRKTIIVGSLSDITASYADSCQVFGYDNHITDP